MSPLQLSAQLLELGTRPAADRPVPCSAPDPGSWGNKNEHDTSPLCLKRSARMVLQGEMNEYFHRHMYKKETVLERKRA